MKVDLNSLNINQNIEKDMSSQGYSRDLKDQQIKSTSRSGGFTLDINNSQTGLNDAAYKEEELKSADEIMMEAGQLDVALQRDYMTVMSNNLSKEDFAELCKDGFDLSNMSYEEQVTSLDKLKCKLAEAGMVVEGFNDDLSDEELNSITGNQALTSIIKEALRENDLPVNRENTEDITEALKKAESISAINDDKLKYMVLNKMEPTIGDLYMAEFSAGRSGGRQSKGYFRDETEGYFGKKAEVIDWEQIKDQAERIVKSAGIEADEEAMKEARWLVEEGIPLTKDTITTLNTLDNLKLPMKIRDCINQMAISISDGARAGEASLIKEKSYAGEAVDIKARVSELTSGELYKAVEADAPINIRSLTLYKEGEALNPEGSEAYTETVNSDKFITASRLLEETRLAMTTEANYRLLKSGISIDTLPLEDLVEKLKEAERDFYKPLLLDSENEGEKSNTDSLLDKRISLYKDSISVYESIKKLPLATLARVDDRGEEFTVSKVNDLGNELKEEYKRAGRSYESLMTAPRSDLGDSIKKAFRNVDNILEDMGYETNDANRRAVRILGYAGTEINEENLERVKIADQALRRVIEKMTPAKTLEMIRQGENPLDENIYALNERLGENEGLDSEKYSKFLVRLENRKEINDHEKNAFIGVFRLFRQIEKSDGKLLGNVLDSGESLTLRNLIKASRSNRVMGMDYSVDDGFGGLSELKKKGVSITDQIDLGIEGANSEAVRERYLNSLTSQISDNLTPERLENAGINTEMSLEELAYKLSDEGLSNREVAEGDNGGLRAAREEEELSREYREDYNQELEKAKKADDMVIAALRDSDQALNSGNIAAQTALMKERGKVFKDLLKNRKNDDISNRLTRSLENISESLTDKESATEAYEELKERVGEFTEERAMELESPLDVRGMVLLNKQISVAAGNAYREDYEVPVEIDGEWTSINLKIVRDSRESGVVSATLETEALGKIGAKFNVSEGKITGYITGDNKEGLRRLAQMEGFIRQELEGEDRQLTQLNFIENEGDFDLNKFSTEKRDDSVKTDTLDLYQVGKGFVTAIKRLS